MIEVKNTGRGHGINARKAAFFVTSQGECLRGDDLLKCSSVNLTEVCRIHNFDWEETCHFNGKPRTKEHKRWEAAIATEFERMYRQELTPAEYKFMRRCEAYRSEVDFGRFRVYGGIHGKQPRIALVTEFVGFCDDDKLWKSFNSKMEVLKAFVGIMSEETHSDVHYKCDKEGNRTSPDIFGPNHGRMERQVECSWRVEGMNVEFFKAFVRQIRRSTQRLWKASGVGVM